MKKFQQILFWCEFPQKIVRERVKLIDFATEVYVAARDLKEYGFWRKMLQNKHMRVGVWPALPLKAGYWFSKYTAREHIDVLKQFDGVDMKIDIEPPIPYTSRIFKKFSLYLLAKDSLREAMKHKAHNQAYLWSVIRQLKSKKIIMSGFPFPNRVSRRYGDDMRQMRPDFFRNHFLYVTFFQNRIVRECVMGYYAWYVRAKLRQYAPDRLYFAIGCVGQGIFATEPVYERVADFERDLDRFLAWGVRNVVVFNLEGILGKDAPEIWVDALKKRLVNVQRTG